MAGVFVMARTHACDGFPRFARYGSNVLVVWDELDPATNVFLEAAVFLGMALVTRSRTTGDAGDIAAMRDIESRVEGELSRLEKMKKLSNDIREDAESIGEETRKAEKALGVLLRKAQSTLRALNVEVHDEAAERVTPILLRNESMEKAAVAVPGAGGAA